MKRKNLLAGLLAGAMVLTSVVVPGPQKIQAAEEDSLVASFSFEDALTDSQGGDGAAMIVSGLGAYREGNPTFEEGFEGKAVRLGDYGLKLNKTNIGDNFTLSMWVKPDGIFKENQVVAFLGFHNPEQWVGLSGGALHGGSSEECKFWAHDESLYTSHTTLGTVNLDTEWHKVTITGDAETMSAYVDGVQIGSGATNHPLAQPNGDIYIGVNYWDSMFSGLVDEVKVYSTTSTAEEVRKDYLKDIGDPEGFKVASYSFEAGLANDEGTDAADAVVTGLSAYEDEVVYEDGFKGSAIRLGDYGLRLNQANLGENFTVSMWLKADGTFPENQVLMFLGYHDPEQWIAVSGGEPWGGNSSLCKFWAHDSSLYTSHTTLSTMNIGDGIWHQLTLTGSESTVTAYLDGQAVAYADGQNGASNHPLAGENQDIYIGVNNWDTEFEGLVDEIEVYDCTLSAEDIAAAYEAANADPKEGKIAEYTFEESIADNNGEEASAIVSGLGAYGGDVKYEAGFRGEAVRLGDYGLQLNKTNLGENFTVSMWVKPDGTFAENQVLTLLGYHSPEQWLAVSGSRSGTSACKFWANGGGYGTWTTLGTPTINADGWHQLVITGTESTVTAYLDGAQVGSGTSNHPLAQENGDIYLGVNNWDAEFSGLMDDVELYKEALSAAEISQIYTEDLLAADAAALTVPSEVSWDITLPSSGNSGQTTVTWTSDKPEFIDAETGKVNRPAQGEEPETVVLTAVISNGNKSASKTFTVSVLPKNPDEDILVYAERLSLNAGFVSADFALPETAGEASVTWTSSDPAIAIDGNTAKVTRPEGENKAVTLTAEISLEGASAGQTKEFPLTVVAEGPDVMTYISNAPATGQNGGMKIAGETENGFEVLHSNQPILYASKGTRSFGAAQIFRKGDGSFGAVASDGGSNGNLIFFTSEDLITYSGETLVSVPGVSSVSEVNCVYDSANQVYKIFIQDANGTVWESESADLVTAQPAAVSEYEFDAVEGAPADAVHPCVTALTQTEYDALVKKFAPITNTGVQAPADIEIGQDEEYTLPEMVTAEYSDGTTKQLGVVWNQEDLENVDTSTPGTYEVRGEVQRTISYTDPEEPLVKERADPFMTYDAERGMYYFTGSYPTNGVGGADGYDRLVIREASTIEGLSTAEETVIWDESWDDGQGNPYSQWIWAPELHKIGDYWYIISTAGTNGGDRFGTLRPFMMRCTDPDHITDPDSWEDPVRVKPMAGDEKNCLNAMSLDMTYFEAGGQSYLAWADFTQTGISSIYIATIDPSDPTQLTSPCSVISRPEYSWEYVRATVNEGPAVFKNNGKVYLAFSASGTGSEYCVGLLTAEEGADLLDPASWVKSNYPLLTSTDFNDEVSGPGHNSFTVDQYGNVIIVYHARPAAIHSSGGIHNGDPLQDPCRYAYLQPVNIAADGSPVLNMTPEQELADEYRNVSITITVSESQVEKTLTGIEVTAQPAKTEYQVGEAFDPAGMEVTAVYSNGETEVLGADAEGLAFTPEVFTEAGEQTVTVLYTAGDVTQTASVAVTVTEKTVVPEKTLTGISAEAPEKTTYTVGEELNLDGLKVTALYSDGTSKDVTDSEYVTVDTSACDMNAAGTYTIKVSYTEGEFTAEDTFAVTVKAAEPTETPTQEPTQEPTETPTQEPTEEPTETPTQEPTQEPTETPTQEPTQEPAGTQKPSGTGTPGTSVTPGSGSGQGSAQGGGQAAQTGDASNAMPAAAALTLAAGCAAVLVVLKRRKAN